MTDSQVHPEWQATIDSPVYAAWQAIGQREATRTHVPIPAAWSTGTNSEAVTMICGYDSGYGLDRPAPKLIVSSDVHIRPAINRATGPRVRKADILKKGWLYRE